MSNPPQPPGSSTGSIPKPQLLPANESQGDTNVDISNTSSRISTTANTTTNHVNTLNDATTITFITETGHETPSQCSQQGSLKRKRGRPRKVECLQQLQQPHQLQGQQREERLSQLNIGTEPLRRGRGRPRKNKAPPVIPLVSRDRTLGCETKIPSLQERLMDPQLAELVKVQTKRLLDDFYHSKLNKARRAVAQYWYEIPRWQEFCELNFHNFCLSSYDAVECEDYKWNTSDSPVDKLPGDKEFREYLQRERAELKTRYQHDIPVDDLHPAGCLLYAVCPEINLAHYLQYCLLERKVKRRVLKDSQLGRKIEEEHRITCTPLDQNDEKTHYLVKHPVSVSVVEHVMSVLTALHRRQSEDNKLFPFTEPPRKWPKIIQLEKGYSKTESTSGFHASDSREQHCEQRKFYEPEDLVAMADHLLTADEGGDLAKIKMLGRRFNILAAHHMLLHDQDIRSMQFSEMFHKVAAPETACSTTQCDLLVIRLTKGKTNQKGQNRYVAAARHRNVHRCTFGAFALYMFSMLHQGWDEQSWRNAQQSSSPPSSGTRQHKPQQGEEEEQEDADNVADEDEEEHAYAIDAAFGQDDDSESSIDNADDTDDGDHTPDTDSDDPSFNPFAPTNEGVLKVNDGSLDGDEMLPRCISQALLDRTSRWEVYKAFPSPRAPTKSLTSGAQYLWHRELHLQHGFNLSNATHAHRRSGT
ncbi:hypothetical protein BGW41_006076 [Actinomortierella wolfii]|nr:hypothetical protein BGW41_006076 [Actinomortierella wolfii]